MRFLVITLSFLISTSTVEAKEWWEKLRDRVKPSIVNIMVDNEVGLGFDTEGSQNATGSIVNWDRGVVLTNRHVSTISPVSTLKISFSSGEETDARVLYYDSWHDFAFLKFDPKTLTFTKKSRGVPWSS